MLPKPLALGKSILLHLGESVIVPLGLFYGLVTIFGLGAAMLAALVWASAAIVARVVRGQRPPLLLLAATAMSLLQVGITYAANSATAYFLQPTVATFIMAAAMLATLSWERPLIQRLAHDFCPLPDHVTGSSHVRLLFRRLSVLWGAVLLANAGTTLGLLLTMSTTWSVPVAAAASIPAFGLGLLLSALWFRRSLAAGSFELHWATS
ncbi:MAG TPA: VC0807 family protein [Nocardioidaceae bacterium]|nr:VC0807 family protein [Nocardioidaceae bacterium]